MKKLLGILVLGLLWWSVAIAEVITTTDGRRIDLKNDGTYSILNEPNQEEYIEVDIVDLFLEKEKWLHKKVKVYGHVSEDMRKDFTIYENSSYVGISFRITNGGIPKEQVRFALKNCTVTCNRVYILGKVVNEFMNFIEVKSVIFPK